MERHRINRNMGCIEIALKRMYHVGSYRLIETWDVLKLDIRCAPLVNDQRLIETWDVLKLRQAIKDKMARKINRNMGCIEILWKDRRTTRADKINRNMGCIEILQH